MKIGQLLLITVLFSSISFSQPVKIMSFNIRYDNKLDGKNSWDNRKDSLVQFLRNEKASIVGIQEALLNQVEFMIKKLPSYKYIGVGRDDGDTEGEYTAILYNSNEFEVSRSSTFWLSETPDTLSVGWDAALPRICTYGFFVSKRTSNKVWVFNTHFDHIGKEAREQSAILILDKIDKINKENNSLVLMGDLNARPNEKPITIFSDKLNDGLKVASKPFAGEIGTFNGFSDQTEPRRIDYIFSNKMNILSYNHIYQRINGAGFLSDHYPVVATLQLD